MTTYRKKPVEVKAFRYWIDPRPDWFCDKVTTNEIVTYETHCEIRTLEGVMRGEVGDYIIQGIWGEVYPCKPDIFEASYSRADVSVPDLAARVARLEAALREWATAKHTCPPGIGVWNEADPCPACVALEELWKLAKEVES